MKKGDHWPVEWQGDFFVKTKSHVRLDLDFGGDNIVEYVTYQEFGRSEVLIEKSTMNLYLNSLICAKDAKSADFREC